MNEIVKSQAAMEDLVQGVGPVVQDRGGVQYTVGKIALPYGVANEAEMQALDVTKFSLARIFGDNGTIDYRYDPLDDTGIQPIDGEGSWLELLSIKDKAQDAAIAELETAPAQTALDVVARVLNVETSDVGYGRPGDLVKPYMYVEEQETAYATPNDALGEVIVSVTDDVLETDEASYNLRDIYANDTMIFHTVEDEEGWEDSTDLQAFKDKHSIAETPNEYNIANKSVKVWKRASGIKDSAVAASFSLGDGDEQTTQVAGYNTVAEMADYSNRDSVAVFAQNIAQPANLETVNTTYTSTTVTSVDIENAPVDDVLVGMTVEIFDPINYVSRIEAVIGDTIYVSAWFVVGGGGTTGTPTDGNALFVNMMTKVWAHNANVRIPPGAGANSATVMELGIMCEKVGSGAASKVYDAINLGGEKPGSSHSTRGGFINGHYADADTSNGAYYDGSTYGDRAVACEYGHRTEGSINVGYQSEGDNIGHEVINPVVSSYRVNIGGSIKFNVNELGSISGSYFPYQLAAASTTLSINSFTTVVTTPSAVIAMPSPTGNKDKLLLVTNLSGGDITVNGMTMNDGIGTLYQSDGAGWIRVLKGAA